MTRQRWIFGTVMAVTTICLSFFTVFIFTTALETSIEITRIFYIIALLLSGLFVSAMIGSTGTLHSLERSAYLCIMSVVSYSVYLFLISIPVTILLITSLLFSFSIPQAFIFGCIAIGLAAGIIGHMQSWHITTTNYEVVIENLPAWWHGKRAVILSDTHFGLVRHERFAKHIIKNIFDIKPDVVFHAGDFYDGPNITTKELTKIWSTLTEKIPTFYTSGNHEHYGNYPLFIASIKDAGVVVLEDEKVIHEGMQIAGIVYRGKHEESEVRDVLKELNLDPSLPTILINHPPTFHEVAHKAGVSLMLSGHTHNGQFWPGTYLTRAVYGIFYYGKQYFKGMHTITSRGVGTAGPPLRFLNPAELVVITFK